MLVFAITLLPDTYRCTIDESPDIRIEYGIGALSSSPAKVIVAIIFFRWLNDASFRHRSMCFPCKKSFPYTECVSNLKICSQCQIHWLQQKRIFFIHSSIVSDVRPKTHKINPVNCPKRCAPCNWYLRKMYFARGLHVRLKFVWTLFRFTWCTF